MPDFCLVGIKISYLFRNYLHDIFDTGHDAMGPDLCNAGAFYQGNIKYIIGILVVIQPMNHCLC